MEEVKQNDLMQKVGDLAATMQKDHPENAKQKAEELMAIMAEKKQNPRTH